MSTTLTPAHAAPPTAPRTARRVLALVVALPLVVAALFIALGLPAAKSGPHQVPIGVVGIDAATLTAQDPDAFDVTTYADAAELREAVLDREVYGGVVAGPDGAQVLTASGASPTVATLLAAIGTQLGAPVQDLVPLPDGDPRGTGFAAAALPLTMAGLLPAVLLSRVFRGRPFVAAGTAVLAAAAIGGTVSVLLQWPFGAIEAGGWAVAGVVALSSAAISLTVLGLIGLLGNAGLGLGAVLMVFLGSPLSGLASAPEMLPAGWGAFGQFLPPGAAGQALRSAAYFDGAAAGGPLLVLGAWAVLGALLISIGVLRRRTR